MAITPVATGLRGMAGGGGGDCMMESNPGHWQWLQNKLPPMMSCEIEPGYSNIVGASSRIDKHCSDRI